jgi:hypothetical protein
LFINIYRTPVSGVFRRKDSGFAVCGENLASISQFVAGKRHGRQSISTGSSPDLAKQACVLDRQHRLGGESLQKVGDILLGNSPGCLRLVLGRPSPDGVAPVRRFFPFFRINP